MGFVATKEEGDGTLHALSIGAGLGRDHETTLFYRFAAEIPNVQVSRWKEGAWGGEGKPQGLWINRHSKGVGQGEESSERGGVGP